MIRKKKNLYLMVIFVSLSMLSAGCDPDKVVGQYFKKVGLNRLAAPRTDIEPGGLILKNKKGALYIANMLDYLPGPPSKDYNITAANEISQYQAVLSKYTGERTMDANIALGFIQTFVPANFKQGIKLNSKVTIDLINAQVRRMKIPQIEGFLTSGDSKPFRDAVQRYLQDKDTEAFLVYEVWRTNKLNITSESGTDVSQDVKLGETKDIKLSSAEGTLKYTRTSKNELVIDGDTFYDFAIRAAKLERNADDPNGLVIKPLFTPDTSMGVKGANDDVYSASIGQDFEPVIISRQ